MKMSHLSALVAIACGGCVCPSALAAQSISSLNAPLVPASLMISGNAAGPAYVNPLPSSSSDTGNAVPASTMVVAAALPKDAAVPARPLTARWLDLTAFTHSQRYRNQFGDTGFHYFEDGQARSVLAGTIKLDAGGKYGIGFRASSGRTFNWSYSDYAGQGFTARLDTPGYLVALRASVDAAALAATAAADPAGFDYVNRVHSTGWQFWPRELYLTATPVSALTFEFGSLGIERGHSSEITTFDDDGYVAGERVRLHDPKHFYFDQVGFTSAYFGDFSTPDFFERGDGLKKSNYRQLFAKKQVDQRIGISAEYNWLAGTHTLRQAAVVQVKETKILDSFRLETYERLNAVYLQGDHMAARQGLALVGQKSIGRLSGDFGAASIDRDYGVYTGSSFQDESGFSLNGDNYNTGIRVISHTSFKITSVVSAFAFYTRITGQNITNINTQGLNTGLTFNLKALVNTEKAVF